jgi:hypothetical protein
MRSRSDDSRRRGQAACQWLKRVKEIGCLNTLRVVDGYRQGFGFTYPPRANHGRVAGALGGSGVTVGDMRFGFSRTVDVTGAGAERPVADKANAGKKSGKEDDPRAGPDETLLAGRGVQRLHCFFDYTTEDSTAAGANEGSTDR